MIDIDDVDRTERGDGDDWLCSSLLFVYLLFRSKYDVVYLLVPLIRFFFIILIKM